MSWDYNFKDITFQQYSQNAEDGVIELLLNLIKPTPFSVEIGIDIHRETGVIEGNTIQLVLHKSWKGLLIDEDELTAPGLEVKKEFVTVENINDLFDKYAVPENFGLLSIDVDGNDYWLWKALSSKYRPAIVVIEYNPTRNPTERLTIPYDPTFRWHVSDYFGASAGAMVSLAREKGYKLITDTNHVNLFFVRNEFLPEDWVEPSLESLGGALGREYPTELKKPWIQV